MGWLISVVGIHQPRLIIGADHNTVLVLARWGPADSFHAACLNSKAVGMEYGIAGRGCSSLADKNYIGVAKVFDFYLW